MSQISPSCVILPPLTSTDRSIQRCALCKMYIWFTVLAGLALLSLPFLKTLFPYLGEDCVYILRSIKLGIRLVKYKKSKPFYSIVDCFLDAAKAHPRKTFLHFEGREYSYGEVDKQSNKVARALQAEARLKEGDSVALFLANEPCFVWIWLGLAKLGCPAALLNYNIRSKSLLHCFSCCGAKMIIVSAGKTEEEGSLSLYCPPSLLHKHASCSQKCKGQSTVVRYWHCVSIHLCNLQHNAKVLEYF